MKQHDTIRGSSGRPLTSPLVQVPRDDSTIIGGRWQTYDDYPENGPGVGFDASDQAWCQVNTVVSFLPNVSLASQLIHSD